MFVHNQELHGESVQRIMRPKYEKYTSCRTYEARGSPKNPSTYAKPTLARPCARVEANVSSFFIVRTATKYDFDQSDHNESDHAGQSESDHVGRSLSFFKVGHSHF